jgi:nitrogen fixation NifU-like protein
VYNDEIMDRYQDPLYYGALEKFDLKIDEPSSSCGDKVTLYLRIKEGRIEDIRWEGEGCIISMVSTDMFCGDAIGKQMEELENMDDSALLERFPIKVTSGRYNCVLLPLKAIKKLKKEK